MTDAPSLESVPPDRSSRAARSSLVAGIASIALAPIVLGIVPAAIGLHGAAQHLRRGTDGRATAWIALLLSSLGAIASAGSAVVLGMILMIVLLQRSAIDQARGWVGKPLEPWTLVAHDGRTLSRESTRGSIVLVDVFGPGSPMCSRTTRVVSEFASGHPDVAVVSWAPEGGPDAAAFARGLGALHPIAVGPQQVGEPLSLVAAKPTLLVIGSDGTVRAAVLGAYDAAGLARLVSRAQSPHADD